MDAKIQHNSLKISKGLFKKLDRLILKFKTKTNQRPSNNQGHHWKRKESALIDKNHKVLIISEEKE